MVLILVSLLSRERITSIYTSACILYGPRGAPLLSIHFETEYRRSSNPVPQEIQRRHVNHRQEFNASLMHWVRACVYGGIGTYLST